jgi:hypothetical protein
MCIRPATNATYLRPFLLQFISLPSQFSSFYGIFPFVDLVIEFDNFAIGLTFALVAADDFEEVSRLRLQRVSVRLFRLRYIGAALPKIAPTPRPISLV